MRAMNLNLIVRNRKVHFLALLLVLLAVVFHTLHGQGISLQPIHENPHAAELTYASVLETINSNNVVTDVEIRRCVRGFSCGYPNAPQAGTWIKMPTKLNLFPTTFSLFNYYMFVHKARGNEALRFVVDVQLTPNANPPTGKELKKSQWTSHRVSSKLYIWIRYLSEPDVNVKLVRDLNVLYGNQDLLDSRKHWNYQQNPIMLPIKQSIQPHLSLLAISINDEASILNTELEFDSVLKKHGVITTTDPKFKIMQLSDMHIGQDLGNCFEADECKFDVKTLQFIEKTISVEGDIKLIIITGDMIDFDRLKHFESVVLKALSPVLKAQIPFIFTFGDSDYDHSNYGTKINVLNFISSLPGCYNKKFADLDLRVHGLTNGDVKVFRVPAAAKDQQFDYNSLDLNKPDALVTVLDSEEQEVDQTQSNYLYRVTTAITNPNVHKMLFFHYPLPNFRPEGKFQLIGSYNEKHTLVTNTDKRFRDDVIACGYRSVGVGHEHENDACIWSKLEEKSLLLCYSGVTGESGRTRINKNFTRRMRVFEINFDSDLILSWKRQPDGALDAQEIYNGGAKEKTG